MHVGEVGFIPCHPSRSPYHHPHFLLLAGVAPGGDPEAPCLPLVVQGASFNCEYDLESADWRLLEWLQAAGVLGPTPPTPPPLAPTATQDNSAAVSPSSPSSQVSERIGTSVGKAGLPRHSSSGGGEDGVAPGTGSSPRRIAATLPGLQQADESKGDGGGGAAPSPASPPSTLDVPISPLPDVAPSRVFQMLSRSDAAMGFSADVRLGPGGGLQVLLPDAMLHVPHEVR